MIRGIGELVIHPLIKVLLKRDLGSANPFGEQFNKPLVRSSNAEITVTETVTADFTFSPPLNLLPQLELFCTFKVAFTLDWTPLPPLAEMGGKKKAGTEVLACLALEENSNSSGVLKIGKV